MNWRIGELENSFFDVMNRFLVDVVPRIYVEKARAYYLIYFNLLGTAKL